MKQLQRTIPVAKKIRKESTKLANETDFLINKSKNVSSQIDRKAGETEDEKKDWQRRKEVLEEQRFNYSIMVEKLSNKTKSLQTIIQEKKEEEDNIISQKEFSRRRKVLGEKCNMEKVKDKKPICGTVSNWWGSATKCKEMEVVTNEYKCRQKLDNFLEKLRNERLDYLENLSRKLQNERLEFQKEKLDVQLMQQDQFAGLKASGLRLTRFKIKKGEADGNLEIATISLDLATRAMIIVQQQLKKLEEFWNNIVAHTNTMIQDKADREGV